MGEQKKDEQSCEPNSGFPVLKYRFPEIKKNSNNK